MDDIIEIWKPVVGYEGFYEVSNLMRVRSIGRLVNCMNGSKRFSPGKILKTPPDGQGYHKVDLCVNGLIKSKSVHRLVAEAFIPNPQNLPQVDHIIPVSVGGPDVLSNLRWVSSSGNANNEITLKNKSKAQLAVSDKKRASMTGKNTVELLQYDERWQLINVYPNLRQTCNEFGWNYKTIYSAVSKSQSAYGYYWKTRSKKTGQIRNHRYKISGSVS